MKNELPEVYISSLIQHMRSHNEFLIKCNRPESNRWIITLKYGSHSSEIFHLEILVVQNWISFTSFIMENLEGEKMVHYYEFMNRLSSQLNGLSLDVSKDGKYISLQSELSIEGINFNTLFQSIEVFRNFYMTWFPVLLSTANQLSLNFRKENNFLVDEMIDSCESDKEILAYTEGDSMPLFQDKDRMIKKYSGQP